MNKKRIRLITEGAAIAALYAVLTVATWEFSSLAIQCRLSEGLCVLCAFTPAAVPGLFVGCLISNIFGGQVLDMVFGSLATLIAAAITRKMKGMSKWLLPLPTIVVNAIVIPFVLVYGYGVDSIANVTGTGAVLALTALSIAIGEALACYVVGMPLYEGLKKVKLFNED